MQRRKNKVVGALVCGPDEQYLEATLKEFARLCDETVVCLNNGNQEDLIKQYGFKIVKDDREWGKTQWRIKQDLLNNHILPLKPDWVIALDADEVFDKNFNRDELEKLADKGGAGYYFYVTNLYDAGYSKEWSFWNIRMFNPEYGTTFTQKALHPGLAPEVAYHWGNYAPFILKHYGLKSKVDRDRKVLRYKKYDPDAKFKGQMYYDFLASEAPMSKFNEEEIHNNVEQEVKDYKHKIPSENMETKQEFVYVRRLEDGVVIDIPKEALVETLTRGFELVEDRAKEVAEVVEIEQDNGHKCDTCQFIAKSEFGLKSHARKHK